MKKTVVFFVILFVLAGIMHACSSQPKQSNDSIRETEISSIRSTDIAVQEGVDKLTEEASAPTSTPIAVIKTQAVLFEKKPLCAQVKTTVFDAAIAANDNHPLPNIYNGVELQISVIKENGDVKVYNVYNWSEITDPNTVIQVSTKDMVCILY